MSQPDTIAAISTAAGDGGIAIVRISGPESLAIADQVFHGATRRPSEMDANTAAHGYVQAGSGEDADEVILLVYHPPRSYTRETVVELQGHGGRMAAKRILRAVLEAGARVAEPGEFTRRAFLNGRIDLVQAEAVCDLINARTDRAAAAAIEQLEGSLSNVLARTYDSLMVAASDLEALLDFDDGELPEPAARVPESRVQKGITDLESLLETWEEGHLLREGATVVIAGQPNVGKSTLLNALLGRARAIVSEQPGTTRDTIEEQINLGGVPVRLVDTAGLRTADCEIEQEGVSRAETSLARADLVLLVVDSSRQVEGADRSIAEQAKACLVVLNKTDLGQVATMKDFPDHPGVAVSLADPAGVRPVSAAMAEALSIHTDQPAHAVISERHRQGVQEAVDLLRQVLVLLQSGREEKLVLAAADLRKGLEALGTVTGRIYSEELLDSIFSRFCVGK